MDQDSNLTQTKLNKIVNIKASINWGISNKLKSQLKFLKIEPVKRPVINTLYIPDPNWISGFVSGDGCFLVNLTKASTKLKEQVQLSFRVTQHQRDIKLKQELVNYLKVGKLYPYKNKPVVYLEVFNLSDIINIIKPFFEKYTLLGVKQLNFLDWCKVLKLIEEGSHLTKEGKDIIREINSKMATGRIV